MAEYSDVVAIVVEKMRTSIMKSVSEDNAFYKTYTMKTVFPGELAKASSSLGHEFEPLREALRKRFEATSASVSKGVLIKAL